MRRTVVHLGVAVFITAAGCVFPSFATLLHVPDDYSTINHALDAAVPGDTVLLAHGDYLESFEITIAPLTIAGLTLLDGDTTHIPLTILRPRPADRICTIQSGLDEPAVLYGLTFSDADLPDSFGSALYVLESNVLVESCVFSFNNTREGNVLCEESTVMLENNLFVENHASLSGCALTLYNCSSTMNNNRFLGNTCDYWAGATHVLGTTASITNNQFIGNAAQYASGALSVGSSNSIDSFTIRDNLFEQNFSNNGGAIYTVDADTLRIDNNVFRGNWVDIVQVPSASGGALLLGGDTFDADIANNQFYYNSAVNSGAAAALGSSVDFHHNLLFRNHSNEHFGVNTIVGDAGLIAQVYENLFFENGKFDPQALFNLGAITANFNTTIQAANNDFIGNHPIAAGIRGGNQGVLEIENNYWGHPSGPYHQTENPDGLGDTVHVYLDPIPFSTEPHTTRWLHTPDPFALLAPDSLAFLPDDNASFRWNAATDSSPVDTIRYTLELASTPDFGDDRQEVDCGLDTSVTVLIDDGDHLYYWRVKAIDMYGLVSYSSDVWSFMVTSAPEPSLHPLPSAWSIAELYPNPFNDAVRIGIDVPTREAQVLVAVYDLLGRRVAVLHDGPLSPGRHHLAWQPDGATGVYLLHARAGRWQASRKLVFMK